MQVRNMKQKSVDVHDFSMIPKADIPRSAFKMEKALKTAFSFSYLVPILCEEVLPGDTWNCRLTTVARTAIPVVPIMDNWHLEYFAFFVPNRLLWTNWVKFMGEQTNPGDSISYTIPVCAPDAGYAVGTVQDYFGLTTIGQNGGNAWFHSALPLRAYNLIFNQWFRDENLTNSVTINTGDGPDPVTDYTLLRRTKRHDYFTSCLPSPQKGATPVTLPLGTRAEIRGLGRLASGAGGSAGQSTKFSGGLTETPTWQVGGADIAATWGMTVTTNDASWFPDIYADLSTATAATINQIRQSFQIQKLLERDARGGTRYTEIVRSHFGVISPDARLQRPEYIGGGRTSIETSAIPQTSATGIDGSTTPAGTLAATGYAQGSTGFTYASTEHGYIIMLANARADITYSQGLRKLWTRQTRYDFYFPVFAMLGEQAVLQREIYSAGTSAGDTTVFGYQERWAEYRYNPSQITGIYRPTETGNLAEWHSSQLFGAAPTLNSTFITDDSHTVVQRNFTAGALTEGQQIQADLLFSMNVARPLPMYSVPGLIDHF